MSIKHRRSFDEILWENKYLLVLAYFIFVFFSLLFLACNRLKDKIFTIK
ncbi:MAG: hypothetical protein NT014_02580 [Candidatus Omnitrophica bacterium]|nr:hypothetical protein [Candidatus Omnitrophota bacterium]